MFRALPADLSRLATGETDIALAVEQLETEDGKRAAAERVTQLIEGDPKLRERAERVACFRQIQNPR